MPAPDSNPKSAFGVAKPGIHAIPPVALLHCGRGMEDGEAKYGLTNWRENSVAASVYYDAAFRHMAAWWDGEQVAPDSGVHHLGHVMACCAILLDAEAQGNLIDNRPGVPGAFAEMVKAMTRPMDDPAEASTPSYNPEDFTERVSGKFAAIALHGPNGVMAHLTPQGSIDRLRAFFDGDVNDYGLEIVADLERENEEARAEAGLCEDEGCPHHGIPHVCVNPTAEQSADMAQAALLEFDDKPASIGVGFEGNNGGYFIVEMLPEVSVEELRTERNAFYRGAPSIAVGRERRRWFKKARTHIGSSLQAMNQAARTRLAFYLDLAQTDADLSFDEADDILRVSGYDFGEKQ